MAPAAMLERFDILTAAVKQWLMFLSQNHGIDRVTVIECTEYNDLSTF